MKFNASFWIRLSIFNLFIVAFLGVIMRYKIGFDFPYLNQKNIQHAHSHFAFLGWVTHTLYVLMVNYLSQRLSEFDFSKYRKYIVINLALSYGMLISFFFTGYSIVSIVCATLTIVNNSFLAYCFFSDFKKIGQYSPSIAWFKSALWFNLISSLGTFYLAYMMASKNFNEHLYLASVYFYLHFQYNGFFIFVCVGLLLDHLPVLIQGYTYNKNIFKLFFISCIPSYFLSTLWANLPVWLYIIVVISAFMQVIAMVLLFKSMWIGLKNSSVLNSFGKLLLLFVALAFSAKITLQLGSTIPELSKLAFGFRPVVIAYLHLVLLAVVSGFLITFLFIRGILINSISMKTAIGTFFIGILLNEVVLAVQGIASFSYLPVKYVNEMLFAISLLLLTGAIMMVLAQRKSQEPLA